MAKSITANAPRNAGTGPGPGPLGWREAKGAAGSTYRIYQLDRADHIRAHCVLRCEHDEAAVAEAVLLLGEYPFVEVWNEARMVRRLATSSEWPPAPAQPMAAGAAVAGAVTGAAQATLAR